MAIWIASSDFQGRFERKSWILESCLIKHCNFFQKYIHIDLSIMDKNISLHKYIFIYYVCMCCIYRIMGLESMVGDKVKNQRITCKNSMTLRVSSLSHGSDILMTHTEYPEIRRYKSTVIWFVYLSLNKNIYIWFSVAGHPPPPSYGIPPPLWCGWGGGGGSSSSTHKSSNSSRSRSSCRSTSRSRSSSNSTSTTSTT